MLPFVFVLFRIKQQTKLVKFMNYVRSKQPVAEHGEVFTSVWMVEAMLDLVKDETERIDSRFLEQALAYIPCLLLLK